ncbi:hypothetical protein C8R42DRAFT_640174 [Lentinula raphanica]|nr:hypothetical protein C8R42DRAFT_640174 [Lentinula raphanica]
MIDAEFKQCSSSEAFNVKEEATDEAFVLPLVSSDSTSLPRPPLKHHEAIIILDSDSESKTIHAQIKAPSSSQDGSFDWDSDYSQEDVSVDRNKSTRDSFNRDSGRSQSDMSEAKNKGVLFDGDLDYSDFAAPEAINEESEENIDWDIKSVSEQDLSDEDTSDIEIVSVHEDEDSEGKWMASDTVWLDEGITSEVLNQQTRINRNVTVDRVERILGGFPSYYPVPRVSTAYLLDASDEEYDGKQIHKLIADKEQESWLGSSGLKDSKPGISLFTGNKVKCIRKRQMCSGVYACDKLDPSYLNVQRHELDPDALKELIQTEIQSRITETDNIDKKTLVFWNVIHSSHCKAVDSDGAPCNGRPIMKALKRKRDGFSYFIACSNWSQDWSSDHQSFSLVPGVSKVSLSKLFHDVALSGISAVSTCTRILPARIGARVKICGYPHNANGEQSKIVKIKCGAQRSIFYPEDTSIRQACIIYKIKPHEHPVLPASKATLEVQDLFRRCVVASGLVGHTVQTVEAEGKSTSLIHPSLVNRRQREKIMREEKTKKFPQGLGIAGVWALYEQHSLKPESDRYIQRITSSLTGGTLIFTLKSRLLHLVHSASAFEIDGTFKRVIGEFDEVEISIWHDGVSRAVTIGRVYITRKDVETYKCLFDHLQELTEHLTKKPLRFKALSRNGNLLALGTDMELAMIQGAGKSFLKTNEPDYSNIHTSDAEEIVKYFSRICLCFDTPELKSEYERIKNFMYLFSDAEIDEFTSWVNGLKNTEKTKAIKAWWKDKLKPYTAWAITPTMTNINETQHKFTNEHTRTKTSIVEAILLAYDLDTKVENEIYSSLEHGILKNPHNTNFHCMGRNLNRKASKIQKHAESAEHDRTVQDIRAQIARAEGTVKGLKEDLRAKRKKHPQVHRPQRAESSSSGRVKMSASIKGKAREIAAPYPAPYPTVDENGITEHAEEDISTKDTTLVVWDHEPPVPLSLDSSNNVGLPIDQQMLGASSAPEMFDNGDGVLPPVLPFNLPLSSESVGDANISWGGYNSFLHDFETPRVPVNGSVDWYPIFNNQPWCQ